MHLRFLATAALVAVTMATGLIVSPTAVSAQTATPCFEDCPPEASGGVEGDVLFVQIGRSGGFRVYGGGSDGCTYWPVAIGAPIGPGKPWEFYDGANHYAQIAWDCDDDGLIDGDRLMLLIDARFVAEAAFRRLEDQFPEPDIVFMLDFALSQEWTPVAVGEGENYFSFEAMSWEPISVTETMGPFTATTTATPLRVEWDTGPLNDSRDHPELRHWTCDSAGDIPFEDPEYAPCRVWFMTSSAGQIDNIGTPDRITMTATIIWQVSYTSNIGIGEPQWFTYDTVAERHQVAVAEIHSIIID